MLSISNSYQYTLLYIWTLFITITQWYSYDNIIHNKNINNNLDIEWQTCRKAGTQNYRALG